MKLLPINTQKRVNTEDSLGHGMDAVIMLAIFLLAGYGLDRLFGTMPIFMIVMTVVGSVGLFYKFKYSYSARMLQHEQEWRSTRSGHQHESQAAAAAARAAAESTAETAAASDPEAAA